MLSCPDGDLFIYILSRISSTTWMNFASFTDLRIPLVWKNMFPKSVSSASLDQHQIYAVFCMIKIESDVFDTSLVMVDSRLTDDVVFQNDVAIFENIAADFELSLEVYCQVIPSSVDFNGPSDHSIFHDDVTPSSSSFKSSTTKAFRTPSMPPLMPPSSLLTLRKEGLQSLLTPKRIRDKISHSVGRTFGRKFTSSMKNYPSSTPSSSFLTLRSSSTALTSLGASSLFAVQNSG